MLFPKDFTQVSLIGELSFIIQYGTLGADYVSHSQPWTSEAPIFNFRRYVYHSQIKFQAYPDVAAQGDNYKIFVGGKSELIGGTSASSPTFTAFVSLLNDARMNAGLPPLGFLNPFLYSKGFAGLNDITIGNSTGCGTQGFNVSQP
jgi:hypothetical protein